MCVTWRVLAGALDIFQGVHVCSLSTEVGLTEAAAQGVARNDVTEGAEGGVTQTIYFLSSTRSDGHFRVRGALELGLCCSCVCFVPHRNTKASSNTLSINILREK